MKCIMLLTLYKSYTSMNSIKIKFVSKNQPLNLNSLKELPNLTCFKHIFNALISLKPRHTINNAHFEMHQWNCLL